MWMLLRKRLDFNGFQVVMGAGLTGGTSYTGLTGSNKLHKPDRQ